ncbi:MAG: asparagine synthase C-terminal domain-containing protein, partial [Cyclobacteriaceae bacterium]
QVRSHQQVIRQQDFIDAIPDILAAMDQPSIDGINTYFISRVAREAGVKAVLSGIGADELFGGYPSFGRADHSSWMNAVPDLVRRMGRYVGDDRLRKVEFPGFGRGFGTYLLHRGLFTPSRVSWLLDTSESDVRGALHKLYESIPEFVEYLEPLEQVSYLESAMYMQYQLLKDADYMGMWHGLEIRVPFLHDTVLETVQSIAPEIKYHPDLAKHLLIKAFGSRLPLEIWNRPKQGFTFPFEVWMKQLNEVHSPLPQLDGYHHQLVQGRMYWSRYWAALLSKM